MSYLTKKGNFRGYQGIEGIIIVDPDNNLIRKATAFNRLYYVQIVKSLTPPKVRSTEVIVLPIGVLPPFYTVTEIDFSNPVMVQYRKLGYLGIANIYKLVAQSIGINLTNAQIKAKLDIIYPVYATTKAINKILRDLVTRRITKVRTIIYIDTQGPYPVLSQDRAFYLLAITNNAGRFSQTERFTYLYELLEVFLRLVKRIEREINSKLIRFRLNNELLKYGKIIRFFEKKGITLEPLVLYNYYINSIAKRAFRTKREKASSIMFKANLNSIS